MPYKNITQINDAINKRIHGDISHEECEDLIRYLYNKVDADLILNKLEPFFQEKQKKEQSSNRRRHADSSMTTQRGRI